MIAQYLTPTPQRQVAAGRRSVQFLDMHWYA
jgi:hypothetical protein